MVKLFFSALNFCCCAPSRNPTSHELCFKEVVQVWIWPFPQFYLPNFLFHLSHIEACFLHINFFSVLIIWQLFHHFCSSEAEHKGIRSPEGWWKRRTGQNCQKVHWSASTAVSSHSISVLCLLSTVVWSKMNPIVPAAKALSVPFCLHLHSQHLKKTHASVGLNLTRVTGRCCILSAKQGSHCSSTPEDSFPERLWLFELCM